LTLSPKNKVVCWFGTIAWLKSKDKANGKERISKMPDKKQCSGWGLASIDEDKQREIASG
jgi:hypothetical protein